MLVISRRRRERIVLFDADGKRLGFITAERGEPGSVRIGLDLPGIRIVRDELLDETLDAERLTTFDKSA